ncbi:MAG: Ti-type conjugative transfer relaxase TraA [Sideroxydans sp.]|nr:Ti-type conjugative transfer relaxase TraA [Sideroxydans sp.]
MKVQFGRCAHKSGLSRSEGRSSTAAAAYRSGVEITDERTGEVFDYTRKGGIEHSEIIVPDGAHDDLKRMADLTRSDDKAERAKGQGEFWNANEKAHKRGDSITAREVEVDFPHELGADDRKQLALEYGAELANKWGVGVQVSMHEPRTVSDDDLKKNPDQFYVTDPDTGRKHNGNWHCHYLMTTKEVNGRGFGNKVKELDPKERQFKPTLENPAEWNRPRWESKVQAKLDERGIDKLYSTRTKDETKKQLIERGEFDQAARIGEPTKHMGPHASAMERKGTQTEIGDKNRTIKAENGQHVERADLATRVLDKLTDQQSVFTERDLYREICKSADDRLGDQLHETVAQCVGRSDVVLLGTDDKGNVRMTTKGMQDMERRMVDQSTARKDEGRHPVDSRLLDKHAEKNGLSDEQTKALHHMSGKDGVSLVEGMAGTGKSTMMKAAHSAWKEAGYEVRGAALAGKAADGLEEGSGIKSQTVASLLMQLDSGRTKLNSKTILAVDEAGMLSSGLTSRLVDHTTKAGAKLVLIGDDRQLQPIQAGGAFKAIKDELGAGKLSTIYRQKDEWARDAVHKFADGKAGQAISDYSAKGLVRVGADADDTKKQLVSDWNKERTDDGRSAVMLAGTRKDVQALNQLARAERVQSGEIEQGERVKTEQGEREFSKGDRVVFLKNDKATGVKNGKLGTVENIERDGEDSCRMSVRGDDGKLATFSTGYYDRIDHGYATTVHKAQGVTVERAYVLSGSMHDRELSYVSMSRSRQETKLYVDSSKYKSAAALARQMNTSHQKGTTLDADKSVRKTEQQPIPTKDELVQRLRAKIDEQAEQQRPEAPPEQKQPTREAEKPAEPAPRQMTAEEQRQALSKPKPQAPNRELTETRAIGEHAKAYRADLQTRFKDQHGERPDPREGNFIARFGATARAEKWDREHGEIDTAVKARTEFLRSDDPRAVNFRESAWERAEQKHETEHSAWASDRWAAVAQQSPTEQSPQPKEKTMSSNNPAESNQEKQINQTNTQRAKRQAEVQKLAQKRERTKEQKQEQERSPLQGRGGMEMDR